VLEGAWSGNKIVVIWFPDERSFREWAESPEYTKIAEDSKAGANSVILRMKGIPGRGEAAMK
jgi:uncharacterized protein (DUF1330 family)